jgi:hypothetical protein
MPVQNCNCLKYNALQFWHCLGNLFGITQTIQTPTQMKTFNNIIAAIIFTATAFTAQAQQINFETPVATKNTVWAGSEEVKYTQVNLSWSIAAVANVAKCEVECSFDMQNFFAVETITEATTTNDKVNSYSFNYTSKALDVKPIAQYRIKQTNIYGQVSYSEVKTIGLN